MEKLKVGDKAPDFKGKNENGEIISLSDYKGKKLVLYFYPKDMTPGCTNQACNLRDEYSELKEAGYEILGVSPDPEARHQKFIEKYSLPFHLIADTDKEIANAYGVWGLKKFMGREYMGIKRTTFVIENGKITKIIDKVKTKDHAAQILEQ
ncbi:MAG TPA: thioredoxin-dependent thiol peroxidase [Saprospiraceae bacterium]|nr:thioredoxin-dependent thiol peroxidase [Saprospiraceae bacterium]